MGVVMIKTVPEFGTPALVAEAIRVMYGERVTRQQVQTWYARRGLNGFPEKVGGLYPLGAVLVWWVGYVPQRGRPRK
jgi:hypothetical protein